MGCNSKLATINELKERGIIDEVRRIQDAFLFERYNKNTTQRAIDVYGINTNGKLLFSMVKNSSYTYFAEPNSELFDAIDEVKNKAKIKIVYQGIKNSNQEKRGAQYYALSKEEAQDYGPNVTQYRISTVGVLNAMNESSLYNKLKKNFSILYGRNFDILNNTSDGLKIQDAFFKFLAYYGYKGLDYTDYSDSQYLVTFHYSNEEALELYNTLNEKYLSRADELFISPQLDNVQTELELSTELSKEELDKIYAAYGKSEANRLFTEDKENALSLFADILFDSNHFSDNFTTNEQNNSYNRTCK